MKCNICRKKINEYMAIVCRCSSEVETQMCISCSNVHNCESLNRKNSSKEFLKKKLEKVVAVKVAQI